MRAQRRFLPVLIVAALALAAGCSKRRVWTVPTLRVPTTTTLSLDLPEEQPPDIRPDGGVQLSSLVSLPRFEPARPPSPRPPSRPETPVEPEPSRPAAPLLSPRLSQAEVSNYQRITGDAIAAAERNLSSVNGRTLTEIQQDMVEKIRGFLGQSRDAMRASDWPRAHNLAQKAQLLSVELVNSLT